MNQSSLWPSPHALSDLASCSCLLSSLHSSHISSLLFLRDSSHTPSTGLWHRIFFPLLVKSTWLPSFSHALQTSPGQQGTLWSNIRQHPSYSHPHLVYFPCLCLSVLAGMPVPLRLLYSFCSLMYLWTRTMLSCGRCQINIAAGD